MPAGAVSLFALLAAARSGTGRAPASRAETNKARLESLFTSLARTHGGPSFVALDELARLRLEALRRLESSTAAEAVDDVQMELALTSTCEWALGQLNDTHASYIQPTQAEEMNDRYHGRVELGVSTCDEPCHEAASLWGALRLPPRPRTWRTRVTAVAARSPAEMAGLRVGDEILEVAGTALLGSDRAVEPLLQAEEGTRVPILVRRAGCDRPIRLSVRCRLLPPPTVCTRLVRLPTPRGAIGSWRPSDPSRQRVAEYAAVVQIDSFGAGTADEVAAELRKLRSPNAADADDFGARTTPKRFAVGPAGRDSGQRTPVEERAIRAILFDLRDNGGGLVRTAVQSSRLVVPRGSHILSLQKQSRGTPRTVCAFRRRWYHRSTPFGDRPSRIAARSVGRDAGGAGNPSGGGSHALPGDMPVVVLVNRNTASAAEVFAAALSHAGRALVVGSRTFGKGTSQAFLSLDDGYALTFTVYSLGVGARRATQPLNDGVSPHLAWPWAGRARGAAAVSNDREIVLATMAALEALAARGRRAAPIDARLPTAAWTMPPFLGEEPPRPIDDDAAPVPQVQVVAATSAPACRELYVGNLPPSATSELLTELMLQVGPLQGAVHFPKDDAGTGHRGYAFAEFTDAASVQYAIALFGGDGGGNDGLRFGGRRLRVNEAGGGSDRTVHPSLAALRELAKNPRAWEGEVQKIPQASGDSYGHVGEGNPRPLPYPRGLSSGLGVPPAQAQAMQQQVMQQQLLLLRQQAVRLQMLQQQRQQQQPNMQMHNPQTQMNHHTLAQMNHPPAQMNYYPQAQNNSPQAHMNYQQAQMNHQQAQMHYYPQAQQQQYSQMQTLEQQQQAGGQQWGGGG